MKNSYFEKVENKYVFNLSRIFWHFFIAIGTLTIIGGVAALAYSILPNIKSSVTKAEYPPAVEVTLSDIQEQVITTEPAGPVTTPSVSNPTPAPVPKPVTASSDTDKVKYDNLIKQLETLIPPAKYTWEGSGHYEYPYGENYWNFYKTDKYRVYVKTGGGVIDNLNNTYEKADCYSYKNKCLVLESYISIIKQLNEEDRMGWLNNLMGYTGRDFRYSIKLFQQLAAVVPRMPKSNTDYLHNLVTFYRKNKKDGPAFLKMVTTYIAKFEFDQRTEVLNVFTDAYTFYFNNDIAKQEQLTENFMPLLPNFKQSQQPRALMRYYTVFLGKNKERQEAIDEIELEYNKAMMAAETEYAAKRLAKEELRLKSVMGIGAGIAFVSIIAILLVFLSIQRSVKNLEGRVQA